MNLKVHSFANKQNSIHTQKKTFQILKKGSITIQKIIAIALQKMLSITTILHTHVCFVCLSVQQLQALLIFFSKSFSHFPHGICLL